MLIRASYLAAMTVLLSLNSVSGHPAHQDMYSEPDLPPYVEGADDALVGTPTRPPQRLADRSEDDEEMMTVGTDMVMTKAQYKRLHEPQIGRRAGTSLFNPWTRGRVPYQIHTEQFTDAQLAWIQRAMRNWEAFACVKFVNESTLANVKNKLDIKKGSGCSAVMGMAGGAQHVTLADGCFWKGTIEHELGHALGLIHEHQRQNRDNYLRVNYFAADSNKLFDLVKYSLGSDDKYGLPYDYHSVMHYAKTTFSKVWNMPTMHPKMANKTDVIGQTIKPSFLDYKLINLMYNCKAQCKHPPVCPEPCFVNSTCGCVCERDMEAEVCGDLIADCAERAARGDCKRYDNLHHKCRQTCGVCKENCTAPQLPCVDFIRGCTNQSCGSIESARYCEKTCNLCVDNNVQGRCEDKFNWCREWAEKDECDKIPEIMLSKCKRSCDFCLGERLQQGGCQDFDTICSYFKAVGGCTAFPAVLTQKCPRACGNCDHRLTVPANCKDKEKSCFRAAWEGRCIAKSNDCPRSCNHCQLNLAGDCLDTHWVCPMFKGECNWNKKVQVGCRKTCNRCHIIPAI